MTTQQKQTILDVVHHEGYQAVLRVLYQDSLEIVEEGGKKSQKKLKKVLDFFEELGEEYETEVRPDNEPEDDCYEIDPLEVYKRSVE